jgi:uncharacterized membrane protein
MLWFILSLFGALSQSTRDLFSKQFLQNSNEYVVAFSRSFFSSLCLLPLLFFIEMPNLDNIFWLTILFSASLFSVSSILYMRALKISPLSLTIPMLAFTPLFLLITSPLILGEFPSFFGLTGILLIVFGTYVLGIKEASRSYLAPFRALVKEKGPLIMLFVAIIFSIVSSLIKLGIEHSNPLFFPIIFNVFTSGLLFPAMLTKSKKSIKRICVNVKVLFAIGLFSALMSISVQNAMKLAIVPYVISVKRTNIIFSTLYGYFFLKEKCITERLVGALIMVSGVLLISLF